MFSKFNFKELQYHRIMKNIKISYLFFAILLLASCSKKTYRPVGDYDTFEKPTTPDYTRMECWAAHPEKEDNADRTPGKILQDNQDNADVDVFFLYPTIYTGNKNQDQWNAPIDDEDFNKKVDDTAILNQASIFNGAGKIYAPRYRQAHIHAYFTHNKDANKKSFALAYSDVKAAFQYYLDHYNNGRPFIIASHSQGTTHAGPLMKEFIDGKPLAKQLVAAYTVGIEVPENYFKELKPCETPEETGCFCTWRTWERGYLPRSHKEGNNYVVTNPLNWTIDTTYAEASLNKGAVLYNFKKGTKKELVDAQVHDGVLWVKKPKFFGSAFVKMKNYHIADFNLFYANVRENAILRVKTFLEKTKE